MFNPLNETPVNGSRTMYGTGSGDFMLDAIGLGQNQVLGSGSGSIDMDGSGVGALAAAGAGTGSMAMEASGAGAIGASGTGSAALIMGGAHGIPAPHVIPAIFNLGHPSRRLLVDAKPGPINEE